MTFIIHNALFIVQLFNYPFPLRVAMVIQPTITTTFDPMFTQEIPVIEIIPGIINEVCIDKGYIFSLINLQLLIGREFGE